MRLGYIIFLLLLLGMKEATAESLPANPWLKAQADNNGNITVEIDESNVLQSVKQGENSRTLNPYKVISDTLQESNLPNQTVDVYKDLKSYREHPFAPSGKSTGQAIKIPAWSEILPQVDLSGIVPETPSVPATTKRKSSVSGSDEFSKAVSDIEKQYDNLKKTTNSYYQGAVRNAHELEKNARDSVNQLQKLIK